MTKNHQEIDNKISVLEDICDRADIRISKLKYELGKLSEPEQKKQSGFRTENVGLPTYQKVIKSIQHGKTIDQISRETGISEKELEVLSRLVEVSSGSQS